VGCCTHGCRRDCPSDYPTISPNYGYAPVRAYIVIPFTDKEIFEEKLLKLILQFTSYKAGVGCCTHGCRRDCPSDYPTISLNYGYAPVRAYIVIPFTDKEIFEEKLLKFIRKIF